MTYPDAGLIEQVVRDQALVYLDRRALPEVLVLVLHPKGRLQTSDITEVESPMGWSSWTLRWRVVNLWTVPADQLLALGDVGVVPWVPLSAIDGPPEPVLRRCRERIDGEASAEERENMLAVSQVFAGLRYNDPALLAIFGGRQAMIESPILQELKAEWSRETMLETMVNGILAVLQVRFGPLPEEFVGTLGAITDTKRLDALHRFAVICPDLDTFQTDLQTSS